MTDSFEQDPLLNAGKAVWSGVKGLFSAVKGGGPDPKAPQERGPKDSQENTFYFDKEKNRWRQRGVDDEVDASEYDPMTGKKLAPKVTEPPPPPPPSMPMGGGPTAMGMSAASSFGARRNAGSLYVNPLAPPTGSQQPPPALSPAGAPPPAWASPPPAMAGGYPAPSGPAPDRGPLSAPFGGLPSQATLPLQQPVRSSPFG